MATIMDRCNKLLVGRYWQSLDRRRDYPSGRIKHTKNYFLGWCFVCFARPGFTLYFEVNSSRGKQPFGSFDFLGVGWGHPRFYTVKGRVRLCPSYRLSESQPSSSNFRNLYRHHLEGNLAYGFSSS